MVFHTTDPNEREFDRSLRPTSFGDFVGQAQIRDNLRIAIEAARERREPLDHVLLCGPPGLGKTTLAHLIAGGMGGDIVLTSGPALGAPKDLAGTLTRLQRDQVLFIDEIHRLPKTLEEYLYSAMEDHAIDVVLDPGPSGRSVRLGVQPFTLVGATTREGLLTAAFRSRFGIVERLEPYPSSDIEQILLRAAQRLAVTLTPDAAALCAERSRGTPRMALRILRRVRDLAQVQGKPAIDLAAAREGLDRLRIDALGLEEIDRKLLRALVQRGDAVGLKTLAAMIDEAEDTLEEVLEPHLIRCGLLARTPRGRVATLRTYEHLGLQAPAPRPGGVAVLVSAFRFELLHQVGKLRRGRFHTPHGSFETPCFAPVGTYATLKGLTPEQVKATGAELILANSYHLHVRPGAERIERLGGLHRFMGWDGPILTDSGGYQVFSLGGKVKIDDAGVTFQSVIDGSSHRCTPESVLTFQRQLGPDIAMVLDHCPAGDADRDSQRDAHERTLRWARMARDLHEQWGGSSRGQAVFGICQGGIDTELRVASAEALAAMDFDGYAIGGLSVGETKQQMAVALDACVDRLPTGKIRYMMGVGMPEDLLAATAAGVDMFDCVVPTRHGRNHTAFGADGASLKLRNAQYADDPNPLVDGCGCYCCRKYSRAYLRHLAVADEMLAGILLSIHNIHFLQDLMRSIRRRAEGVA